MITRKFDQVQREKGGITVRVQIAKILRYGWGMMGYGGCGRD